MARFEQIPADSIYKRRAKPRYDEARTLLVAEHMAAADKARTAGRCAEVQTEVAEITRLDPRNNDGARAGAAVPSEIGTGGAGGGAGSGAGRRGRPPREAAPQPDVRPRPMRRPGPNVPSRRSTPSRRRTRPIRTRS